MANSDLHRPWEYLSIVYFTCASVVQRYSQSGNSSFDIGTVPQSLTKDLLQDILSYSC